MITTKKLARMTRKWQNLAAITRRKRSILAGGGGGGCAAIASFEKGCFVVYTSDEIRFVVPLDYLKNPIFQQLLEIAEDEYGLQSDGPIRLPFKAAFMRYTVSMIERQMGKDLEEEFHMTITSWRCLSSSNLQLQVHPLLLVG